MVSGSMKVVLIMGKLMELEKWLIEKMVILLREIGEILNRIKVNLSSNLFQSKTIAILSISLNKIVNRLTCFCFNLRRGITKVQNNSNKKKIVEMMVILRFLSTLIIIKAKFCIQTVEFTKEQLITKDLFLME